METAVLYHSPSVLPIYNPPSSPSDEDRQKWIINPFIVCKLILGNDYTTLENARKQLHILSFEETMFIHKAKILYKIANNVAPIYLIDLFQMRG